MGPGVAVELELGSARRGCSELACSTVGDVDTRRLGVTAVVFGESCGVASVVSNVELSKLACACAKVVVESCDLDGLKVESNVKFNASKKSL